MKKFKNQEIRDLLNQVYREEISFSRMVEIMNEMVSESEVSEFKDGDFVVNMAGDILIFREKVGDFIYDHAYFIEMSGDVFIISSPTINKIERLATEAEKQELLDALSKEGKRWNEEKKCVEDIPKRKFQKGDKVRIKHGISSETAHGQDPVFQPSMDYFIGTIMTVNRYDDMNGCVVCDESDWRFREDWLEPCVEELKECDLAIFWDNEKEIAIIKPYGRSIGCEEEYFQHKDQNGFRWRNAIKFESKEQFNRFIKGEI